MNAETSASQTRRAIEAAEVEHHDRWAAEIDADRIEIDALFESGCCPENQDILKWMGDLRGKHILDVGCGLGEASVYFSKKGATVTAVDSSACMLDVARRLASRHGVSITTVRASASDLSALPDRSFDYIYAANLLHHVDIPIFLEQVKRKLRPEGAAFFWDPLHYNPIIRAYRGLATAVRTPNERALRTADLNLLRDHFDQVEVKFRWFLALGIFLKYFLIDRLDPNRVRYWKKVIEDAPRVSRILTRLHAIDSVLFGWLPGARWLGWNIVVRASHGSGRLSAEKADE